MAPPVAGLTPAQLSSTPVQPPPSGVQSNFVDAENNKTPLYVACSLFLAIMLCFFLNRIYTKHYIVQRYQWDDGESRLYDMTRESSDHNTSNNYNCGRKSEAKLIYAMTTPLRSLTFRFPATVRFNTLVRSFYLG